MIPEQIMRLIYLIGYRSKSTEDDLLKHKPNKENSPFDDIFFLLQLVGIDFSFCSESRRDHSAISDDMEKLSTYEQQRFNGTEIILLEWNRSLCSSAEYPAFGDPEPIVLPDVLTEQMSEFEGFACYETTFVLDNQKKLFLEISDSTGGVEVFINGETAGMRIELPYRYDLSDLAWQGKNYLAIEVAVIPERKRMATTVHPKEKIRKRIPKDQSVIIGFVRLYTN
jgi:hypothetical protein